MEASGAGLAGAGDGQAQGSQQQGVQGSQEGSQQESQTQQANPTEGLATSAQLDELRSLIADNPMFQPPEETAPEPEPLDTSFLEDPAMDPATAAKQLADFMDQQAQTKVQEALAPVQQQLAELQSQQGADTLVSEFPELAKPENAEALVKAAERNAQMIGQPELVSDFGFLRLTYLAGRASELAQNQNTAASGGQAATLEGAAGASPGSQGASDVADQIGQGWAQRGSVLPF